MRKLFWLIIPVIVLGALLLTSTVTCGCDTSSASLAGQMAIYTVPAHEIAPVERNEALGRQAFIGRDIKSLTAPGRALDEECSYARALEINCEYWNETGVLISRGRRVRILAQPGGKVVEVTVRAAQKSVFPVLRK